MVSKGEIFIKDEDKVASRAKQSNDVVTWVAKKVRVFFVTGTVNLHFFVTGQMGMKFGQKTSIDGL